MEQKLERLHRALLNTQMFQKGNVYDCIKVCSLMLGLNVFCLKKTARKSLLT